MPLTLTTEPYTNQRSSFTGKSTLTPTYCTNKLHPTQLQYCSTARCYSNCHSTSYEQPPFQLQVRQQRHPDSLLASIVIMTRLFPHVVTVKVPCVCVCMCVYVSVCVCVSV